MNIFPNKLFVIVLTVLISVTTLQTAETGQKMPDFSGKDLKGKSIKSNDYAGKVILIDIWGSWCNSSVYTYPMLAELHKRFSDSGLVIVSINVDRRKKDAQTFLKTLKSKIKFPVIWDKHAEIAESFNIKKMPTAFLVDKSGEIRYVKDSYEPEFPELFATEIQKLLQE